MKLPAVAVRKNSSGGSKLNFDRLKSNFDGGIPLASGGSGGQLQRKKSKNPFDDDDDDDEQENDQTIDID